MGMGLTKPSPTDRADGRRPRLGRLTALSAITIVTAAACGSERPLLVGGGNHCSLIDRLVWTSDAGGTYNIYIMDSDGQSREQLTTDTRPVVNQHPVFTPECDRVVWARDGQIWIMNVDGSGQSALSSPSSTDHDGHPWVGIDSGIYFVRHTSTTTPTVHRIWQMGLDGSDQVELIGGTDLDRIHPNLRRDSDLVLYTAGTPGARFSDQIRVRNQNSGQDDVVYQPGWPVSAATWHPSGDTIIVAEDPQRDTTYQIVKITYPGAAVVATLADHGMDNTVPYYAYPSGASVDWVGWPGGRRVRDVWLMDADGGNRRNSTNSPHQDLKIVGEFEGTFGSQVCVPRPVGCFPTPPPCSSFLLPASVDDEAEELGRREGDEDRNAGVAPNVADASYAGFTGAALEALAASTDPAVSEELRARASSLLEFLADASEEAVQRVADLFVASYYAAFN